VSFAPKQHRVVEKKDTVPFKGVRGTRSGAYGRVIKVREVATEAFFARKSGDIGNLTQELDILRGLPPSDHNVSLRASYVKDRQLHLIVTPWAKTDLAQFIANPEVLPGWAAGVADQFTAPWIPHPRRHRRRCRGTRMTPTAIPAMTESRFDSTGSQLI